MDFEKLLSIEDEGARVSALYEIFDEGARLTHSKAARVEFVTTVAYIEKYLKQGDRILDIGAGAGTYSLYFAQKGYDVTAVELAENNIKTFKSRMTDKTPVDLRQGNALDLSAFDDESFDIVLLMGPLYHLADADDRSRCIREAKRVCKPGGAMFFAFINNDMVILTEFFYDKNYFKGNHYDHETFKVEDFPFVFFTLPQCAAMLEKENICVKHIVASDGMSEMLEEKINAMDDESYSQYMKYHFYCCEKPEMLGHTNHLLFVGKKGADEND